MSPLCAVAATTGIDAEPAPPRPPRPAAEVALPVAGARSFRHVMKRPRPARTSAMIQIQDRCERGGVLGGSSGVRVSDGKVVAVRRADEAAAESSAGFACSKVGELFAMR